MIREEETICHKVNESVHELELAMQTGELDPLKLVKRLHLIREQAQKMENGLRRRKEIMVREGLEDEYQSLKASRSVPKGINKIWNKPEERTEEKVEFEVTIKRDGEVVYQNGAYAGVLSMVENIEDIDEQGNMVGETQKFTFGNPMSMWFAFDQLKTAIEARGMEILLAIQASVQMKQFVDPSVKKKIIDATNKLKEIQR